MDRRLITPAEAVLLLAPTAASASKCLQAGLLSLLSTGRIAIEQSPTMLGQATLFIAPPPTPADVPLPSHLQALEQALLSYGKGIGNRLTSAQVLHALQKRFGYGFSRYVDGEVAPALIRRDLMTRRDAKWFGLFPRIIYQRTLRGDALAAPLQRLMLAVEKLPSLLNRDPDQALHLARSAGVLLVMSPKARRQIPALRKLFAKTSDDLVPLTYLPIDSERDGEWEQLLELGDMALAVDVDALFDGLDAVGDFTSGGDSSASDGGDGGGGGD